MKYCQSFHKTKNPEIISQGFLFEYHVVRLKYFVMPYRIGFIDFTGIYIKTPCFFEKIIITSFKKSSMYFILFFN